MASEKNSKFNSKFTPKEEIKTVEAPVVVEEKKEFSDTEPIVEEEKKDFSYTKTVVETVHKVSKSLGNVSTLLLRRERNKKK